MEPKSMTIGPIIGKVTSTTARILAEFTFNGKVTCILTNPSKETIKVERDAILNIPIVFPFINLTEFTEYTVTFDPVMQHPESSFRTLNSSQTPFRAALISCNSIGVASKKDPKSDLWANLADRARKRDVDYAFHMGDQVYMDMGGEGDDSKSFAYQ
jgi:hypothetical protein